MRWDEMEKVVIMIPECRYKIYHKPKIRFLG